MLCARQGHVGLLILTPFKEQMFYSHAARLPAKGAGCIAGTNVTTNAQANGCMYLV